MKDTHPQAHTKTFTLAMLSELCTYRWPTETVNVRLQLRYGKRLNAQSTEPCSTKQFNQHHRQKNEQKPNDLEFKDHSNLFAKPNTYSMQSKVRKTIVFFGLLILDSLVKC